MGGCFYTTRTNLQTRGKCLYNESQNKRKAEPGTRAQLQRQTSPTAWLDFEFQTSKDYIARSCLKNYKEIRRNKQPEEIAEMQFTADYSFSSSVRPGLLPSPRRVSHWQGPQAQKEEEGSSACGRVLILHWYPNHSSLLNSRKPIHSAVLLWSLSLGPGSLQAPECILLCLPGCLEPHWDSRGLAAIFNTDN